MKQPRSIRGILFDLGGVLVGKFGDQFIRYASNKLGVEPTRLRRIIREEEIPLYKGRETDVQFWRRVYRKLKIPYDRKVARTLWITPYKRHVSIKTEMLTLARLLKKTYKIAILSNIVAEHTKINRKKGFFHYFTKIFLSHEVGMVKPEKKFFRYASRELGIPFQHLLFIDDDPRWIKAARRYGINSILFESEGKLKRELRKLKILNS